MRHLRRSLLLILLAALLISLPGILGCVTLVDTFGLHTHGPRVYGGMQWYLDNQYFQPEWYWWPLELLFYLVDFPLSLAVDTLLLPYTIPYELTREQPEESPEGKTPESKP